MIWAGILIVASLGGDPLYDPDPDHPWNAVHRVFYSRRFSNGDAIIVFRQRAFSTRHKHR